MTPQTCPQCQNMVPAVMYPNMATPTFSNASTRSEPQEWSWTSAVWSRYSYLASGMDKSTPSSRGSNVSMSCLKLFWEFKGKTSLIFPLVYIYLKHPMVTEQLWDTVYIVYMIFIYYNNNMHKYLNFKPLQCILATSSKQHNTGYCYVATSWFKIRMQTRQRIQLIWKQEKINF